MQVSDLLGSFYDLIFRLLPHRAPTGLIRIGTPGPASPVLVTGNYTLTLRRLRKALAGFDVWLLAANSRGINVWCAATGGHLTHHDIISVVRTSGIAEQVSHRQLILPQLGATGIEGNKVSEATGWQTQWGPARLEDLPSYLARGRRVRQEERFMRFPLWERLEMATVWIVPLALIGLPLAAVIGGWPAAVAFGFALAVVVLGLFTALPALKLHGWKRIVTLILAAFVGVLLVMLVLTVLGTTTPTSGLTAAGLVAAAIALLAVDFEGTTPWYGSVVSSFRNKAHITLEPALCTGQAECVLVCPKRVLSMGNGARQVELVQPDECVMCGACIVQCPENALYFRYDDGRILPAETVRTTRLNMAGRRSIRVRQEGE